jgi:hypothetical protein
MLILVALLTQAAAFADSPARSTEMTIFSGWSFLNAKQEVEVCPFCYYYPYPSPISVTEVKQSVLFGFKAGYYINNNFEVEGGFGLAPNHNVQTNYNSIICTPDQPCPLYETDLFPYPYPESPENLVSYQYEGNFVYNLTGGDVRPFVTFGVGGVSSDFQNSVRNNFALNFGGGAKFYFKHAGIRLEVNDHVLPSYFLNDKTEHDLQIQYGFIFRLP